jgi:glycine amidinotransferase
MWLGGWSRLRVGRRSLPPADQGLEGVKVRQPDIVDFSRSYSTPWWSSRGFCVACPRDSFLVIGDETIETPMCWRSRYFEAIAYRSLFKEYFHAGARWTSAARPMLTDDVYYYNYRIPEPGASMRYIVNEFEPVFDAADFVRCGRDLFVTRSNVTNLSGIAWLRRHLGDGYRIREIESRCRQPMHIDSSFMPLTPGKVLVNPVYIDVERLPPILKKWDILIAPTPDPVDGIMSKISMCSPWTSIKVLMLDEKRVIVDRSQVSLIQSFKAWGFEPIAFRFGAMVRSAARSIAQRSTSGAAARCNAISDRERFERREAIGLASDRISFFQGLVPTLAPRGHSLRPAAYACPRSSSQSPISASNR